MAALTQQHATAFLQPVASLFLLMRLGFRLTLFGSLLAFAALATDLTLLRSTNLSYVVGGVSWDGPRGVVYLTDQTAHRLVRVSLADGAKTGAIPFSRMPEAVQLSPDGQRLYVATLTREHSATWFDHQEGYLQIIDPASFTQVGELKLQIDPYNLASTDDGRVVIGSGSGQGTYMDTYDTRAGVRLGTEPGPIFVFQQMVMHPTQKWVYVVDQGTVRRFGQDPVTRAFRRLDEPYPNVSINYGRAYLSPAGDRLIDDQGEVFALTPGTDIDFQRLGLLDLVQYSSVDAVAFNPENDALFVADALGLRQFDVKSLLEGGASPIPKPPRWMFASATELFTLAVTPNGVTLNAYQNPAQGGATNHSPVAAFTVTPASPTTLDTLRFDAGATTDDGPAQELQFAWDWNDDGVFDTAPTNNPVARHRFNVAGTYPVRLRVTDRYGAGSTNRLEVVVSLQADPGHAFTNAVPFELGFAASKVAFDPLRPLAYVTDTVSNRLVVLDLDSGRAVRAYDFLITPQSLSLTPDGHWLYVALMVQPSSPFHQTQTGFIAEFDLATQTKTREFPIALNPLNLVATDLRQVAIVPGFGPSDYGMIYDATTGSLSARFNSQSDESLDLMPDQKSFLVSLPNLFFSSPLWEYGFEVEPGGFQTVLRSAATRDRSPFTAWPGGSLTIGRNGDVIDLAPTNFGVLRRTLEGGPHLAALGDAPERPAFFRVSGRTLRLYNTHSFELARSVPLPDDPQFLGRLGRRLFYASITPAGTRLREIANPALGSESNQPPTARLQISPAPLATRQTVTFDAATTTDDQDALSVLRFRWDLDGDGVFDTGWTNLSTVSHTYFLPGTYQVAMEVRDTFGEVARVQQTIAVANRSDPGTAPPAHTPYLLPFSATNALFDPVRPSLWLSDGQGQAIVKVNLTTGRSEKRWSLPYGPTALAITPDGSFLYAALPVPPPNPFANSPNGYVAVFDLKADLLLRIMPVNLSPYSLAATTGGLLLITGNYGSSTLQSHRAETGEMLASTPLYPTGKLRLAREQNTVYVNTIGAAFYQQILRVSFDPLSGTLVPGAASFLYPPESVGVGYRSVFELPGDTRLLGGGGGVFTNLPGNPNDLRLESFLPIMPVLDCVELPGTGEVLLTGNTQVGYFKADTLEPITIFQPGHIMQYAGAYPTAHYLVGVDEDHTVISVRQHPATNVASNLPPTVSWVGPPEGSPQTLGHFVPLTVRADDPDGGIQRVDFMRAGNVIASTTNLPFTVQVSNLPAGINLITAVAYDNQGAPSAPADSRVRINWPPSVTWPATNQPIVLDPGSSYTLEALASDPDGTVSRVDIYSGPGWNPQPTLVASLTHAPWQVVLTNLSGPTDYYAVATDNDGATSQSDFIFAQPAGRTGDDYYRPFILTGDSVTTRVSNTNATFQEHDAGIFADSAAQTLWWSWTAPESGVFEVTTRGSSFDTRLGVTCITDSVTRQEEQESNDNDLQTPPISTLKLAAQAGATYRFGVAGAHNDTGDVVLSLHLLYRLPTPPAVPHPPANDQFTNRIALSGTPVLVQASNVDATPEPEKLPSVYAPAGPSVWWEWTAPTNGLVHITTRGSQFDTVLTVYSPGSSLTGLQVLAANDDDATAGGPTSRVVFFATAGTRYPIAVSGFGGAVGAIQLAIEQTPQLQPTPANDLFADRVILSGPVGSVEGFNVGASFESNEAYIGSSAAHASVWYGWRSTGNAIVYLRLIGGGMAAQATVFQGTSVDHLSQVVRLDGFDGSSAPDAAQFLALRGEEYIIGVDGVEGQPGLDSTGAFTLLWYAPDLATPSPAFLTQNADGGLSLRYDTDQTGPVIVLTSPDLETWSPLSTNEVSTEGLIVLPKPTAAQTFYRLRFP